jgi:general secretion pathway protein G
MRRTPQQARRQRQAGYTLAEMLVVLVILALLTALIAPRVLGRVGQAREQTAKVQADNLVAAIELYRLDVGRLPDPTQGLEALLVAPTDASGWAGPYLQRRRVPADPWNRPFAYALTEDGAFSITSLGADGRPGGEGEDADIVVGP